MAKRADSGSLELVSSIAKLLAPFPGRMEFAARLALICAVTILVVEIYQTPDAALTAYLAFFVIKPDRTDSAVTGVVLIVVITLTMLITLFVAMVVIDHPMWRVAAMTGLSFCLLFAASASKLKPIAAIVALIVGYAVDLLGQIQIGEIAARAALRVALRRNSVRGLIHSALRPASVCANILTNRPSRAPVVVSRILCVSIGSQTVGLWAGDEPSRAPTLSPPAAWRE